MTEKTRDEVLAEYEAAARRSSALGHRWEQLVLIEPLRPGEHEPTITREQIELEDEMLRAWEDYLTKRNAYLAATNTPDRPDGVNPEKRPQPRVSPRAEAASGPRRHRGPDERRRDIGVCVSPKSARALQDEKSAYQRGMYRTGLGTGRSSDGAGRRAQR